MPLNPAPIQQPILGAGGVINAIWAQWFDRIRKEVHKVPSYTVATLPSPAEAGSIVFVSNESGGAVLAFYDGANWRRVTDRAVCS